MLSKQVIYCLCVCFGVAYGEDDALKDIHQRQKRFFPLLIPAVAPALGPALAGIGLAATGGAILSSGVLQNGPGAFHGGYSYPRFQPVELPRERPLTLPPILRTTTLAPVTRPPVEIPKKDPNKPDIKEDAEKKKDVRTRPGIEVLIHVRPRVEIKEKNSTRKHGCNLYVTDPTIEQNLPVPINSTLHDLVVPEEGHIFLKRDQQLILICPGKANALSLSGSQQSVYKTTCVENRKLKFSGQDYEFSQFQCKLVVKGQAKHTGQLCGKGKGTAYEIGHQAISTDWITLIKVCHDPLNAFTLYTEHTLHGNEINYASKSSYRPDFNTEGLTDKVQVPEAYKVSAQKDVFSKLLGSSQIAEKYINDTSFLARGHLAPRADFLLATSQYSTYFYLNSAPKWQKINNGNWKSLEIMIRAMAGSYPTLKIFTGTHGILTYPDANNNQKEIFLTESKTLPVPKHFWKILYDERRKSGIGFVVINDPHLTAAPENGDLLCDNICTSAGWSNPNWQRVEYGFLYCCEVQALKEAVNTDVPYLDI